MPVPGDPVPLPEGGLRAALLHVRDCPGSDVTAIRLRVALDATGHEHTPIEFVLVRTADDAARLDFHGSPTVLLNGRDPFLTEDNRVGLACRVYRAADESRDAPTVEELVTAIQVATGD